MRTAILVPAYNRPDFFRRTLTSFKRCPEVRQGQLPAFFYLDAGPNSRISQNAAIASEFTFPKTIVRRPGHWGLGVNQIEARREVFDRGFDRVFLIEDDVEVSASYFGLMSRLMDWCEAKGYNVGCVGSVINCRLPVQQKRNALRHAGDVCAPWTNYLMTAKAWKDIWPTVYEYQDRFIVNRPYMKRDVKTIQQWMKAKSATFTTNPTNFPATYNVRHRFCRTDWHPPTGQDGVCEMALKMHGYARVHTIVNRVLFYGETGTHSTRQWFMEQRLNEVRLDEFPEDATLKDFEERI